MGKRKIYKSKEIFSELDFIKAIRKPIPPATRIERKRKGYNRKDKSWKNPDNWE